MSLRRFQNAISTYIIHNAVYIQNGLSTFLKHAYDSGGSSGSLKTARLMELPSELNWQETFCQ